MAGYLTCPLCAFEFEQEDTLCAHGCPLGAVCRLHRCPGCGYEFPEVPTVLSRLGSLFGRRRPPATAPTGRTVRDLRPGEGARVVCVARTAPARHDALIVFGIAPGAEVTLLQRWPACVVRVGETDLALDPEIAADILVEDAG